MSLLEYKDNYAGIWPQSYLYIPERALNIYLGLYLYNAVFWASTINYLRLNDQVTVNLYYMNLDRCYLISHRTVLFLWCLYLRACAKDWWTDRKWPKCQQYFSFIVNVVSFSCCKIYNAKIMLEDHIESVYVVK